MKRNAVERLPLGRYGVGVMSLPHAEEEGHHHSEEKSLEDSH